MQAARQLISCRVGDDEFAFGIEAVREIIRDAAAVRVGATDELMLGVVDLRGAAMPIFDLAQLVGGRGADADGRTPGGRNHRIVVTVHEQGDVLGWLVDGVDEVITVSGESIEPLTFEGSEFVRSVARTDDGRLLPLLDHALLRAHSIRGSSAAA